MQVSVEAGEGLERRMKIELPFAQMTVEVDKRLQQLARTAALPGFRPGRAPMKVVRQRFVDRVQQDVMGELVQSSYNEAVEQESLTPAGMPQIELDINLTDQRFAYTATFEVMPEFELVSLADQSLKRPVCELTDADVDGVIERLREQRKIWTSVERACQLGDQVLITFDGTIEGEPFEGGSGSNVTLELGSAEMIEGFEAGLIGATSGEQRDLELTFPEDYHADHLAGKPVHFAVTINAVMEPTLPIIDAEFIQAFGIDDGDLARFRADVQGNMERELKDRVRTLLKERVMDVLYAANSFDLPSALVKEEVADITESMNKKFDPRLVGLFPVDFFESKAKKRVALGLILGKIITEQGLKVEANQIKARIQQMASTYDDPQEVLEYYSKRERIKTVEAVLLEDAVVDWVMEQVQVEDEALDFATLVNPEIA
ncbi:trigger factor [Chromatium okenii]|jgi:trigger factor|uniref:trigger factor n=1 Tax=Chromatium okenii TaxID=61644 RepID=UPI0026F27E83|nr:trigger factor [Chromatium okenii]MBV5309009.1 trigger factor [Chromatium okenii]